jgi:hypothetical protein
MAEDQGAAGTGGDMTGSDTPDDMNAPTDAPKRVTRREALAVLGATTVVGVGYMAGRRVLDTDPASNSRALEAPPSTLQGKPTTTAAPTTTAPPKPVLAKWSDPATWGGKVPGAGDVAKVTQQVLLDVDAEVAGVDIDPAGVLVFDPDNTRTLKSHGNVVVHGTLQMRPASAAVQQLVQFVGINVANYVGDHTEEPLASDVGMWVLHGGKLDLLGAKKKAWTHLSGGAEGGAGSITVDDAAGWLPGDEIVVTPTQSPADNSDHFKAFDRRTVTAVSGGTVTLDRPLDHGHPTTTVAGGATHRAEVLNLSRNVRIEGTADGNSHVIFLHNSVPQALGYVGLRHIGPQDVLGRYGLHWHMCHDGSRGSTVEGVVIADSAHHVFVPHLSDGITFTDCIAHETRDHAFWWDARADDDETGAGPPSNDIVWDRCVASATAAGADPHATTGFMFGAGSGNVARGLVAVGGTGKSEGATGYRWGSGSNDEVNTWVFEDCVVHNHEQSGLYFWQNNAPRTIVDRLTVYNCAFGIFSGAYIGLASYRDVVVHDVSDWGLVLAATPSGGSETMTFENCDISTRGGEFAVMVEEHRLTGDNVTKLTNCTFRGGQKAQVGFPAGGDIRQMYDFVDCTFEGNAFWLEEGVPTDSQIRVVGGNLGSFTVYPPGGPGEARAEWNAAVTSA